MILEGKSGFVQMSELSSIDMSAYTTPYAASQEVSFRPVSPVDYQKQEMQSYYAADDYDDSEVDLSNYYSNVQPPEFSSDVLSDVVQAEHNFGEAVMSAIANGMDPQSAVNIQVAKAAYIASVKVAEVANSTFELMI